MINDYYAQILETSAVTAELGRMAHSGISSTNISHTGWVVLSMVLFAGLLSVAGMHSVQLDLHTSAGCSNSCKEGSRAAWSDAVWQSTFTKVVEESPWW